jgi:hypothetical protein
MPCHLPFVPDPPDIETPPIQPMKSKSMSRLTDPESFRGRVGYAPKVIASGRSPTLAFDNCFENYDGDEVAVAIVRRAKRNEKIARNLDRNRTGRSRKHAPIGWRIFRPEACPCRRSDPRSKTGSASDVAEHANCT